MRDIEDRISQGAGIQSGRVKWDPIKSIWFSGMFMAWAIGGFTYFSGGAVLVFLGMCAIILCGGHSIGMHRKLIHDSFDCPKWLERLGAYLGTLVGLGGPFTMMRTHDIRDWAQRQKVCHDFYAHGSPILQDFWWQVHCKYIAETPIDYRFPPKLIEDRFMVFLQRTAFLQQLPIAGLLYLWGGPGFVFWGVCGRVWISIFGHWLVGYFAHRRGHQDWIVDGAAVQGHNVKLCGLITFGESWHNNHHAFPESARLGLYRGQVDPGWWVLCALRKAGLVSNLSLPEDLPARPELIKVTV